MSAPDNETLRGWLAARIPGDLRGLQLGEDWNRMTMVSRIDTRAGTLNTVARIDHADAAEALATASLFAVANALAEEVLLLRALLDGRTSPPTVIEDEAARSAGLYPVQLSGRWHLFDDAGRLRAWPAQDRPDGKVTP